MKKWLKQIKLKTNLMRSKAVRFDVLTLFPESTKPYTDSSIIKRAQTDKLIEVNHWQVRDFAENLPAPRPGEYFVYAILCENDAIYIGQTQDLRKRWEQHKNGRGSNYTKIYGVKKLIHYEKFNTLEKAVEREKKLKTGFGRK